MEAVHTSERRGRRIWAIVMMLGLLATALAAPTASAKGKGGKKATANAPSEQTAQPSTGSKKGARSGSGKGNKASCIDAEVFDASSVTGSMYNINQVIGAHEAWTLGVTGQGVDIAVIDTGVVPVRGLDGNNKIVNGPDLSFEGGVADVSQLDTFGHGTHVAGIIAGDDFDTKPPKAKHASEPAGGTIDPDKFRGVAPDARLVNIKVGDNTGAVDVTQVIAAIDWAVQHRNKAGMNIRVINLSYRAASTQPYLIDPLARAVENAWEHGIVVVVAAGNDSNRVDELGNPARDPYVIAVGSLSELRSQDNNRGKQRATNNCATNDTKFKASKFASSADGLDARHPDIYAPGTTVVSLRNPGSRVDLEHPTSRVGDRFTKATGTSQATAVVSGAVALLLQARPDLTPDEVKAVLTGSGLAVDDAELDAPATKLIQIHSALDLPVPAGAAQSWPKSDGSGTLDASRGTDIVVHNGVPLTGEVTAFGGDWNPDAWVASSTAGSSWSGSSWSGSSWSGNSWSGASWSGSSWSGSSWSGSSWSGSSWSGSSWSGNSWSGSSWSGSSWSGSSWSGSSWSGASWS